MGPLLKPHKYAELFPEAENFDEMVADIKEKGQVLEPIWLYEGKVLDGWHRYRAAQKARVKVATREYRGDDPLGFVQSMNIERRHLTKSQRAMIRTQIAVKRGTLLRGNGDAGRGRVTESATLTSQLADEAGVGGTMIQYARRVSEKAPDLVLRVVAGTMSLEDATKEVRRRTPQAQRAKQAVAKHRTSLEQMEQELSPDAASKVQAIKTWPALATELRKMDKWGKFSPEAKRFMAEKMRPICELAKEWSDA